MSAESPHFVIDLIYEIPIERLYWALASRDGPKQWWTRFAETGDQIGDTLFFRFPKADFYARFEITGLEPNRLVEWKCIDSKHADKSGYQDLHDWNGTVVRFECEDLGSGRSKLHFEHIGLQPILECYQVCSATWPFYLNQSLRGLLETGEGQPYAEESPRTSG